MTSKKDPLPFKISCPKCGQEWGLTQEQSSCLIVRDWSDPFEWFKITIRCRNRYCKYEYEVAI